MGVGLRSLLKLCNLAHCNYLVEQHIFFLILLPATVDLLFIRHYMLILVFLNSWPIALFSPHSSLDGVDHLIRIFYPNRLPSFKCFNPVHLSVLPSLFVIAIISPRLAPARFRFRFRFNFRVEKKRKS